MQPYLKKLSLSCFLLLSAGLPLLSNGQAAATEVIGAVASRGSSAFTQQQLLSAYIDLIGSPATDGNLQKLRNRIVALYGENTYYLPQVAITKNPATANVFDVTIQEPILQSFSLTGGDNQTRREAENVLTTLMGSTIYASSQFKDLNAILTRQLEAKVNVKPQHVPNTAGDFHLNVELSGHTDFEVTTSNEGSDRLGKEIFAANLRVIDTIPGIKEFYLSTFDTLTTDGFRSLGAGLAFDLSERNELFFDTDVSRARLEVDSQADIVFDKQYYSLGWRLYIADNEASGEGFSASLLGRDFQQSQISDDIDEKLRIVDLTYWAYRLANNFALSWTADARQGLDSMGAELGGPNTDIDFSRVNASLMTIWQFPRQWALRIDTTAQYSGDNLPFSERYAIASNATAKAYESGELSGDSGLGIQFEIRRYLHLDSLQTQWIPYFYYGAGRAKDNLLDDTISGASVGIGSRFLGEAWNGYLEVGKPLIEKSIYRDDTPRAQVSLSYRF